MADVTDVPGLLRRGQGGRLLRIAVEVRAGPGADDHHRAPGATGLRALLVADVLRRVLEQNRGQAVIILSAPELTEDQLAALGLAARALSVPPWEDAEGRPADVRIGPAVAAGPAADGQGPDRPAGDAGPLSGGPWALAVGAVRGSAELPGGADPLVLRYVLLDAEPGEPVELTPDRLSEAAGTLERWRRQVAKWAESPSEPAPAALRAQVRAALGERLGTPAVLGVLSRVEEDDALPDGARFEAFAEFDRALALDLTRSIGLL
jgi:hypothetical protein